MRSHTNKETRWPVSLRPIRGELLYSWVARIAAVYGVSPQNLLWGEMRASCISTLLQRAEPSVLKNLAERTGKPEPALQRYTLAGTKPALPPEWWLGCNRQTIFLPEPPLQVCPKCLAADLNSDSGTQFVRLRWQYAAQTLCRDHLTPLHEACLCCHRLDWPVCEKAAGRRFRFLCRYCGNPRERISWPGPEPGVIAVEMMVRFENQLLRALANHAVDWVWVGYATPSNFLQLVKDLLWAMTRHRYDSKPIYKLQTLSFPLPGRALTESATREWRLAPSAVRRCLLAAVLALLNPLRFGAILQRANHSQPRWQDLLCRLTPQDVDALERKSWYWPPSAHNALRRATPLSSTKNRFLVSTDSGKTGHPFRTFN
jgi:TniQ